MKVPKGWEVRKFGDLFSIKSGFGFKYSEYTNAGIPLIKIDNVSHGFIKWENISCLPITYLEKYADLVLKKDDLLLALNRPITQGKLKLVKLTSNDVPSILYQRVGRIDFKDSNLVKNFYLYLLNQEIFKFVLRKSVGSDQPFISTTEIKNLYIKKPPLSEQRKIAKILGCWDRAIAACEQLIATSKQQKQALMQQLLTAKKRFGEFTGEWEEVLLSSLCKIIRGASPRPIKDNKWFSNKGRGWVRIADVTYQKGQYLTATKQYLSLLGVEKSVEVDPGDLIVSICGTIGIPKFLGIKACIHDGFITFKNISTSLNLNFLYHYFLFFKDKLSASGQPGTQKNLNTSIVGNIPYPNISFKEQQKIAQVLTAADSEIEILQQKLAKLQQEKQALMQQLLTGKRRVKIDENDLVTS